MNLVGKILVWVILVMSLVFMAFTISVYATQHNWKAKADELNEQLKASKGRSDGLQREKAELEKLHADYILAKQEDVSKLAAENKQYKATIAKLEADATGLNVRLEEQVTTLDGISTNLAADRKEIEKLRTDVDDVMQERNTLLADVISLTDLGHTYALNYATLMDTNKMLAGDLADALSVLNVLGESPSRDRHTGLPPAYIIGQITEVRPTGLVEISVGSDSGMEKGHRLHVYHDGTYLGQIEITMTAPDKAAAKILPEFRTGTIQRGDNVASKLN